MARQTLPVTIRRLKTRNTTNRFPSRSLRGGDIAVADVVNHRVRGIFFDFSAGQGVVLENNPGSTFSFDRLSVASSPKHPSSPTIPERVNVGGNHFIYGNNAMLQAENGRALDITDTTLSDGAGGPATFRHRVVDCQPAKTAFCWTTSAVTSGHRKRHHLWH
ncbi:MAG: hypothetical protein R3C19_02020 [Planctomycetaceae bacterium]